MNDGRTDDGASPAGPIHRRPARSGRVSHADAVVLHESSRTRQVFVPFFISRSEGTELTVKLETFTKAPPPADWAIVDSKSISLKEPAARRLLTELKKHLVVAQDDNDGEFIAIRVPDGAPDLAGHSPELVASALAAALGDKRVSTHLANLELSHELTGALRTAVRISEMRGAVAELRNMLDSEEVREHEYQKWCERHSWAFGSAFVMRDEVRNISAGDRLDLLLPSVISGFRDIVELKTPDVKVLNWDQAHKSYYFSSEVSQAIGQCHRYLDVLHEVAANGLKDHPEIVAYHPRAIVVIGRSVDWKTEKLRALHGLNRRLSGITVMTYDQLLAQGERLLQVLTHHEPDEDLNEPELSTWSGEED